MNCIKKIAWFVCVALVLFACKDMESETVGGLDVQDKDNVFVEVALSLSEGSDSFLRSRTDTQAGDDYASSTDGTEPGKEGENGISEILLVLADADTEENIASALLEEAVSMDGEPNHYVISVPFKYVKDQTGKRVHVYAFCNPTAELKLLAEETDGNELPKEFVDKVYAVTNAESDAVWQEGRFLMSNAKMYETTLPDSWSNYRSVGRPFPLLGDEELQVERAVARFDYQTVYKENLYPVLADKGSSETAATDNPGVEIQLTDIALVNMNNSFYYLRRVAANAASAPSLCGVETASNYVIDPYAAEKADYLVNDWKLKTDCYFYNYEQPDTWNWIPLSTLSGTEEDNYDQGDYRIWRYVTENTIPNAKNQVNAISTGIVFKGRILPTSGCDEKLKTVLEAGTEPIFVHENKLYGTWEMVREAAEKDGNMELRGDFYAVENGTATLEEVGFTKYAPTNGVYETYYYYWNRHNDNGIDDPYNDARMGPMEFAVVRNNVYKLSVDAIYKFGYPSDKKPDPRDPDEPDPDGSDPVFMLITVKVLPWITHSYEIIIDQNATEDNN